MKIYQHTKHTPIDFGVLTHLAIAIVFLIALTISSNATEHSSDGRYIIPMSEHLDNNASIDDALLLCEYWNGEYRPEYDVCLTDAEIIK